MSELFHSAWYLTGPTASGKTAVGVALARLAGDVEVVALDSMTLYRGMDIGTAKPTAEERGGIPHHLLDVLDPDAGASVAEYRDWAAEAVRGIVARGRRALFVGGTPLYLKALLRGLFPGPSAQLDLRARFEAEADRAGDLALHARLAAVDPTLAARLHPQDRRRVVRGLEVFEATGRPLSAWQTEHEQPAPASVRVLALRRPRAELIDRINRRVDQMFAAGLVAEVRGLLERGPLHSTPAQGVGYAETIAHLDGRSTLAEAIERTKARTRQFAKRQETWFRGLAEVRGWPMAGDETAEAIAARLLGAFAA